MPHPHPTKRKLTLLPIPPTFVKPVECCHSKTLRPTAAGNEHNSYVRVPRLVSLCVLFLASCSSPPLPLLRPLACFSALFTPTRPAQFIGAFATEVLAKLTGKHRSNILVKQFSLYLFVVKKT
eukprot:g3792.t1